jgi:hypothetical protein
MIRHTLRRVRDRKGEAWTLEVVEDDPPPRYYVVYMEGQEYRGPYFFKFITHDPAVAFLRALAHSSILN